MLSAQCICVEILLEDDSEQMIADFWEAGTLGVIEKDDRVEAFFADGADVSKLLAVYGGRATVGRSAGAAAGAGHNSLQLDPVLAGEKFFIVPPLSPAATPADRIRLEIAAQNAFGSGSHETTLLVIRALELHLLPEASVLDVGSGSGVLSAAAHALGAANLFACDTDVDATLLTQFHAPQAQVFAGSIDAVRSGSVDLVLANISARVIDRLAVHLSRIVKPEGFLILSGFTGDLTPAAFQPVTQTFLGDWLCWACRPTLESAFRGGLSTQHLQPFEREWW